MSKGSRNRAKRRAGPTALDATLDYFNTIFKLSSADELAAVLAEQPHLVSDAAIRGFDQHRDVPGHGVIFGQIADLLAEARTDTVAAWATYARARARADALGAELDRLEAELDQSAAQHAHDAVIAIAGRAIPMALEAGLPLVAVNFEGERARAFLNRLSPDRSADLEEAIAGYSRAMELAFEGDVQNNIIMQLGAVYSERLKGDRADNLEIAVKLHRIALQALTPETTAETRAMMETNLAVVLVRSEHGDRVARLKEATDLCRSALKTRSPECGADDWAYSQLNLAVALEDLEKSGEGDEASAAAAFEQVLVEAHRISDNKLVALAHHGLGRMLLLSANATPERILKAYDAGEFDQLFDNQQALGEAALHLRRAVELLAATPHRVYWAEAAMELGSCLAQLDDDASAIEALEPALTVLRPETFPSGCRHAAALLGSLLCERGDWEAAAQAFRLAVRSADILFHGRLDTKGRENEVRRNVRLHRWASFAVAKAGAPLEAGLMLEQGRARELRRRLGVADLDDDLFADLPRDLRDAHAAAVQGLSRAAPGASAADAGRQLQEVIAAIRERPRFADFGARTTPRDLAGAVEPGGPLLYVNPTPFGLLLLRIDELDGETLASPVFLESPTSETVFQWVATGDPERNEESPGSYFFSVSGEDTPLRPFSEELDEILPLFGEAVARHVARLACDATTVTLVPCGPIAIVPLHAAPWEQDGEPVCLSELFDIRHAPSATICAAARRRAADADQATPSLVALGDPTGDLRAAGPECHAIAEHFPSGAQKIAVRRDAVSRFLQRYARSATHIHLACHASGALIDRTDAAIWLADGPVSAEQLMAIGPLTSRVVAVSACQSALSEISAAPEESISLGTAFLAAGSACAIVSLWSVDDRATALLMINLYDELVAGGEPPHAALRRAQLWLRELDHVQADAVLDRHEALAADLRSARPSAPTTTGPGIPGSERPYAHPQFWAAFIAVGA